MKLSTHILIGGNCEEALRFQEQHLEAKITELVRFSSIPGNGGQSDENAAKVMHARLEPGETVRMASDNPSGNFQLVRSVFLTLSLDTDEEAERIRGMLSEGAVISMPLQETFCAARFAQFRKRFDVLWTLLQENRGPRR